MKNKSEIINDKYDFSLVPSTFNTKDKLQIICHEKDALGREHGVFETTYDHFIKRGDGCPKCGGRYMDKDLFVYKAKQVHGDMYDYEKFDFVNKKTKGTIICKKHNIEFEQAPNKHLSGQGCPICRYEKSSDKRMKPSEEFIKRAKELHNGKYDYSKTVYNGLKNEILVTCHEIDENGVEHGDFTITASNHVNSTNPQGCQKCARERLARTRTYTIEQFETLANERHENKYEYFHDYKKSNEKVNILCKKHGIFSMLPSNHLYGQGCPSCGLVYTIPEKTIVQLLKDILGEDEEIIIHSREIIPPYELDIFIPRLKLAIEFNGLVWHSEKFSEDYKIKHLRKHNLCEREGIRLIQIFEDEWYDKNDIVISRIKSILGCCSNTIYARNCTFKETSYEDVTKFLNNNHLQGFCPSQIQYGLYYNDELVSVMTFGHTRQMKKYNEDYENTWELLRFAVKSGTNVVGAASKMLKRFINDYNPNEIISYADKRWSNGNLYFKLGFDHTHDSKPNYFYVFGKTRKNRFSFRKNKLVEKGFDENKSEHEIMRERGIYRIYDCGTMVFKLTL